jgi:hypothetical protein
VTLCRTSPSPLSVTYYLNDPFIMIFNFSVLAFYIHLRRSQSRGSRGDIQELTTHAHLNGDIETMANGFATEDAAPVKVKAGEFVTLWIHQKQKQKKTE